MIFLRKLFSNPRDTARFFLYGIGLAGTIVLVSFLQSPSDAGRQFLFGLSRVRLAIGSLFALLLALNMAAILWISVKSSPLRLAIEKKIAIWVGDHVSILFLALHSVLFITVSLSLLMVPPVIKAFSFLEPARARLVGPILWLCVSSALLIVLFRLTHCEAIRANKTIGLVNRILLLASIFASVFFLYEHILIWTGAAGQTRYSYWNLLANAFVEGDLNLENPPYTHDLTLYQGRWYVPMPPFPAILMMPLAYFLGGENIDTSDFSIFFSAVNAVLLAVILEELVNRGWVRLSRFGIILLVILLMFGTPHLWVGIRGRAWFVSQVITVTLLALSVLAALRSWSPWLVGLSLGAAIATRPTGIMTWLFVSAIAMQIKKEESGEIGWKQVLDWSAKTIIPISLSILGLLAYNYARFENPFDFGYTTLNGDPGIVANVQRYGMFSTHYVAGNIKAMLLSLPNIRWGAEWPIEPSTTGTSIFLITPPLIYLVRRYDSKWWIAGAWASVFLTFISLVLYHNTGAHQFGYRYILDAIVPLMAMMAVAQNGRIRWHFVLLVLISIPINLYGTYWFIKA